MTDGVYKGHLHENGREPVKKVCITGDDFLYVHVDPVDGKLCDNK